MQKVFWPSNYDPLQDIENGDGERLLMGILAPGAFQRYQGFEKLRQEKQKGVFFSDIDHNPSTKGPTASEIFPTELRHGTVMAHHRGRPCTQWEVLSSHGFLMHVDVCAYGESPVRPVLEGLSKGEVSKLSGNGMSLMCVWAVWLYLLMHTGHKSVLSKLQREVPLGAKGGTRFFDEGSDQEGEQEQKQAEEHQEVAAAGSAA